MKEAPKKKMWWGPRLAGWCKTIQGGVVLGVAFLGMLSGSVTFAIYKARQISEWMDLPARALKHEVQDSIMLSLWKETLKRDSIHDARLDQEAGQILYYYKSMRCIHDGHVDMLSCPHFQEDLRAALEDLAGLAAVPPQPQPPPED